MKSVEERLNGAEFNEQQARRIYENESSFIKKVVDEQCTANNTNAELIWTPPIPDSDNAKLKIKHYPLGNGIHVYIDDFNKILITNIDSKRNKTDVINWALGKEEKGNGIYITKNGSSISYYAVDKGKEIFGSAVNAYRDEASLFFDRTRESKYRTAYTNNNGENNLLDIIEANIPEEQRDDAINLLLRDFHELLNSLGREDITYETEAEFLLRKEKAEKASVDKQNKKLQQEISNLQQENYGLKERLSRIRNFIINRCGKIPFLGKRILREMQKELEERELPAGTDR